MVGSTGNSTLDYGSLGKEMLAWVPLDYLPKDQWLLVSIVAIWRSGCSLTKPLQKDKYSNEVATLNKQDKVHQLVFSTLTYPSPLDKLYRTVLCIAFAHLIIHHPRCIECMDHQPINWLENCENRDIP